MNCTDSYKFWNLCPASKLNILSDLWPMGAKSAVDKKQQRSKGWFTPFHLPYLFPQTSNPRSASDTIELLVSHQVQSIPGVSHLLWPHLPSLPGHWTTAPTFPPWVRFTDSLCFSSTPFSPWSHQHCPFSFPPSEECMLGAGTDQCLWPHHPAHRCTDRQSSQSQELFCKWPQFTRSCSAYLVRKLPSHFKIYY